MPGQKIEISSPTLTVSMFISHQTLFTQISPDVLLRKRTFKYHYDDVVDFLCGVKYLVGHNVLFDWNFLEREIRLACGGKPSELLDLGNIVLIDTYKSSVVSFPNLASLALGAVAGMELFSLGNIGKYRIRSI